MVRYGVWIMLGALAGCGADVTGTAATAGAARAQEAGQAQNSKQKAEQDLSKALEAGQARNREAERQNGL